MDNILGTIFSYLNTMIVVFLIIIALFVTKWIHEKVVKSSSQMIRQIISIAIILLGTLAFTISLPIGDSLKGQIISLIGVVLSAAFALSSTTLIGNALAGIMNSTMKNFKLGDFISVENVFGRVTKKGLFRTEIQTEDRNLTSIPNLSLATNPVKIIRESGTIISTTVSLGYDLDRQKVEKALLDAAKDSGLSDAFIFVTNLGDFSVSYKISGLLADTTKYFSVSSLLNVKVMDRLHLEKIEIVSPSFMNQRQVNDVKFIPDSVSKSDDSKSKNSPEDILFDKANVADEIENKEDTLEKVEQQIKDLNDSLGDSENTDAIKNKIKNLEEIREKAEQNINSSKDKLDEHI